MAGMAGQWAMQQQPGAMGMMGMQNELDCLYDHAHNHPHDDTLLYNKLHSKGG